MALSTTTLQLQHVVDEIAGTQTSLQDCVDDAITAGFNSTYYTAPATSLAEFRGYETPVSEFSEAVQSALEVTVVLSLDLDSMPKASGEQLTE